MPEPSEASDFAGLLRASGIAPTRQRLDIAALMLGRPCHFTAEQVIDGLGTGGAVSRATVYNTLGLFVRQGLLREVVVERGRVFFDSNVGPHHHVYDVGTGRLRDVPEGDIGFSRLPSLPEGVAVEAVDVVVRVRSLGRGEG